jgi:pantothenate kinase
MILSSPKGSTIYRYSSRKAFEIKNINYHKLRDLKKIERKVITSEEKSKIKKSKLERFVKNIPKEIDLFDDNVSQFIYENKIAFIDYEKKVSFIIESKKIADFQKKIFKILYSKL